MKEIAKKNLSHEPRHARLRGGFTPMVVALICALLCVLAVGCSPKLPSRISAPSIDFKGKSESSEATYVFIDEFIDARSNRALVLYKEKEIPHIEDLGPIVVNGLSQALEIQGFAITDTAPVIVSGQIRQWGSTVTSGLPSKVDSTAEVYVELLDPANKRMYSGVYKGFASLESGSLGEDEVKTALRASMQECIAQIVNDPQLMRLLRAF